MSLCVEINADDAGEERIVVPPVAFRQSVRSGLRHIDVGVGVGGRILVVEMGLCGSLTLMLAKHR
jgi:hypothetical protein